MRWILLSILLVGCGTSVQSKPAAAMVRPTGFQYCSMAEVQFGKHVHPVYVCTPSKALCNKGVKDAKGTAGRVIGVKSVTDCKAILH